MGLNKKEEGGKKDDKKGEKESKVSTVPLIPKEPPEIRNPEEKELMTHVKAEYDKLHDTKTKKKKKGGKAAKGKGKGDEDEEKVAEVDPQVNAMSAYMAELVDSTIEYFIHWQRHENKEGEIYDANFVKELYRSRVFYDVYEIVRQEV